MAKLALLLLVGGAVLGAAEHPGMVLVPGGEFTRGRTFPWSDYEVKWYPNPAKDDEPAHVLNLMDALKKSVGIRSRQGERKKRQARRSA